MKAKERDKEGDKATYGDGDVSGDYFKSGINGFNTTFVIIAAVVLLLVFLPLPLPALAQTPITTCQELQNIRDGLAGDCYLANDIDCSGFDYSDEKGFMPIGNWGSEFTDTFDGQGYKITHLYNFKEDCIRANMSASFSF